MLSVIIPITGKNRQEHAQTCIHFLRQSRNVEYEIILVEQINALLGGLRTGGPYYQDLPVDKYIQIEGPGENHFNQPWMANVGAKIANGERYLFYDIDLVCSETYLQAVRNFRAPYFIAWSTMLAMDAKASAEVMQTKKLERKHLEKAERQKSGTLLFAGYSVAANAKFFWDRLGGYNENYLGWGGNDNDIAWRAKHILGKEHKFDHKLYHLWHAKGYSKFLLWHRRSIWETTRKHPYEVTKRLKQANLGRQKEPTFIPLKDIWVDAKAERMKRKALQK